jgi:hypothetical protein
MKVAIAILFAIVLQGSISGSQTIPTAETTASGSCSNAHVAGDNTYNISCNGIGEEQGKKIVELLNKIVGSGQDLDTVNAKLDELLAVASRPAQTQPCVGNNCVQSGSQTIAPPQAPPKILELSVTPLNPRPNIGSMGMLEGPLGVNPGATVSFTVDSMFLQAMFSVVCDRPCAATTASVGGTSSPRMMTTDKPNITVVALGLTGPLMPSDKITITVRSMDTVKISVQSVESYVQPRSDN